MFARSFTSAAAMDGSRVSSADVCNTVGSLVFRARGHLIVFAALGLLGCEVQPREETATPATDDAMAFEGPAPGTVEWKVASAMSAAPASISGAARVMDWPAAGGESTELRAGTNGWACFPDHPRTDATDPMCLDPTWQDWMEARASRTEPNVQTLGFSYMLQGDAGSSNIDPFATGPTPDNQWVQSGPHMMLLTPDRGPRRDPGRPGNGRALRHVEGDPLRARDGAVARRLIPARAPFVRAKLLAVPCRNPTPGRWPRNTAHPLLTIAHSGIPKDPIAEEKSS